MRYIIQVVFKLFGHNTELVAKYSGDFLSIFTISDSYAEIGSFIHYRSIKTTFESNSHCDGRINTDK